jgi:hypothetical protein
MNRLDSHSRPIQTKKHKELMSTVLIQSPFSLLPFVQCGCWLPPTKPFLHHRLDYTLDDFHDVH